MENFFLFPHSCVCYNLKKHGKASTHKIEDRKVHNNLFDV